MSSIRHLLYFTTFYCTSYLLYYLQLTTVPTTYYCSFHLLPTYVPITCIIQSNLAYSINGPRVQAY